MFVSPLRSIIAERVRRQTVSTTSIQSNTTPVDEPGDWNGGWNPAPTEVSLGNNGTAKKGYFFFTNTGIPQGCTIEVAYLKVTASSNQSGNLVKLTLVGADEDDPSKPTGSADAEGRDRTTATVSWDGVEPWTQNQVYQSPDISTIIQELVSRDGFASNNILLFVEDNGSTANAERRGHGPPGGPARAAQLYVKYTTAGEPPTPPEPPSDPDWWDPNEEGLSVWGAWKPKGAADQASSYTDLTGNGNTMVVGNAPGWDAVNGWTFDGVANYLDTGFTPSKDLDQTVLIQYTDHENAYVCMAGVESRPFVTTHRFYWQNKANNPGARTYVYHTSTGVAIAVARLAGSGNVGVSGTKHYWNGAQDAGDTATSGGADDFVDTFYLGCYNNKGAAAVFAVVYIQAIVIYDEELTEAQVGAVVTEMAAF